MQPTLRGGYCSAESLSSNESSQSKGPDSLPDFPFCSRPPPLVTVRSLDNGACIYELSGDRYPLSQREYLGRGSQIEKEGNLGTLGPEILVHKNSFQFLEVTLGKERKGVA